MALKVPTYNSAYHAKPIADTYAWIAGLSVDFTNNTGNVTVYVHRDMDAATAGKLPIDKFNVQLGTTLVAPTATQPEVAFPGLDELVGQAAAGHKANPTLDPFGAIREVLYRNLKLHPKLAGASEIP